MRTPAKTLEDNSVRIIKRRMDSARNLLTSICIKLSNAIITLLFFINGANNGFLDNFLLLIEEN